MKIIALSYNNKNMVKYNHRIIIIKGIKNEYWNFK